MEKIQHAYKSRNLHIKCPVPNCKYSFSQVYDLMCHFQDNYKSHDIKLIQNIREMIVKELDSHNLKNQKFNHYLLCINCQCPFRDLKAAITHQQKCIFYHEIVRATDQQNTPQDSEGGETNNQSEEKRKPGRPKTSAKGNNNSKNPNTYNPPNNPSSNNNGNNDNPTIIYSSTAKSSKCSVHELSKYCNAEDELAIRERAEEIILKFVHAPQNALALMDDFLGRFTRPQSYLNGFEETEYQTKSRTEDYIMFCINHNRFGLAQSHIERYNAGEKQIILTPEQTQELNAKHFSQTQPAETIYVPARGEDTVVQSQAPLFKIEEVETQIEQMYEYTSAGESGFGNLHLKYSYKTCDRLLIQMFKQGFNQIHEAVTIKDKSKLYKSRVVYIDKHKLDSDGKQDYRPVQVQEALLSCYHSMLKRRLVSKIKINQNQFAITPSGMLLAKQKFSMTIEGGLVAIKFDVKRAFSSVRHELIEKMLIEQGKQYRFPLYYEPNQSQMVEKLPLTPSRNKLRLQPQYYPILWFLKLNHGENTGRKRLKWKLIQIRSGVYRRHGRNHNPRQNPINYQRNDCLVQRNAFRSKYRKMRVHSPQLLQQIRNRELFRLRFWKNSETTGQTNHGQSQKKFDGYAKLDIPNKDKLLLFCQCIVSACNYGPLIDVAEHCAENKQLYQEIDKQLMVDMEEILHSNASSDALQQFAFDFKCQGGLGIILPGAYYDQMKVDQIQKIDYYIRENGDQITKSKLEQIIGKINTKMTKSKNFFRDTRKEMRIQEKMSLQVDDTVPKPGYTLLGRRRMDNTAFQYMINWVFNNVRDTPIPEICELCKKPYKEGHEQDCKKINELNIAAHDRFANFLERILRKRYQARKVCKDNDNRLEDRTKPDISIVVNRVQIYLDIGITWDLDKYYALKEQHYRDKKDQNGNPLKIIQIIIGKNLTIHQKSREFLEELRVNFETIYEEIGYMISTSQTHRAELMYRKKVVQESSPTGEQHSEIDEEKPSANRFVMFKTH
ncbi:Reverse_transcriptase (RNA-dependent DNA polymerase) [Hexamita inflata]|uniref:Reverse transcriptase (RNA-dependent DNA polymerase) n=1 Tax=Hexamita inflata TaxID=28002 RepID=A0AA86UQE5_9EUKA|nr:Reverse transcriptase (RNA-dependent DNA polymerase) [Hexamita inflata]